jgi:RNA polymerase sigma-70 factor (ECF subfamily)
METVMTEAFHGWQKSKRLQSAEVHPSQCSDLELTQRAAGGDMQAFEEVYRRHQRRVYSLCLRMTQNVAEAEDLTQEVFVHLFKTLGSFRGESAFATWLHRLTTNRVLMHFRKVTSRKETLTEDGTTPERALEGREAAGQMPVLDHVALNRALALLPPGYRAVFILHDIEGYEHEEIGEMIGIAAGTSKSQLHKARRSLRKLLSASSIHKARS